MAVTEASYDNAETWGPVVAVLALALANLLAYALNEQSWPYRHVLRKLGVPRMLFITNRSEHVDRHARPATYWTYDLLNPQHLVCSPILNKTGLLVLHASTFLYWVATVIVDVVIDHYGLGCHYSGCYRRNGAYPEWMTFLTNWSITLLGLSGLVAFINTARPAPAVQTRTPTAAAAAAAAAVGTAQHHQPRQHVHIHAQQEQHYQEQTLELETMTRPATDRTAVSNKQNDTSHSSASMVGQVLAEDLYCTAGGSHGTNQDVNNCRTAEDQQLPQQQQQPGQLDRGSPHHNIPVPASAQHCTAPAVVAGPSCERTDPGACLSGHDSTDVGSSSSSGGGGRDSPSRVGAADPAAKCSRGCWPCSSSGSKVCDAAAEALHGAASHPGRPPDTVIVVGVGACCSQGSCKGHSAKWDWLSCLHCLLSEVATTAAFFVSFWFWVGLVGIAGSGFNANGGTLMAHAGNFVIALSQLLLTRLPIVSTHFQALLWYATLYEIFLWAFGEGSGIYRYGLDWEKAKPAGAFVIIPLVVFIMFCLWYLVALAREAVIQRLGSTRRNKADNASRAAAWHEAGV